MKQQNLTIRRAVQADIPRLNELLRQVLELHHQGRPDLFLTGRKKFTDPQLQAILADQNQPVLVAADAQGQEIGYAFCQLQQRVGHNILTDIKTLYLEDLCVDERARAQGVGQQLFDAVTALAREKGCYNLALNVWACNEGALAFYEKNGMKPQKIGLEKIL